MWPETPAQALWMLMTNLVDRFLANCTLLLLVLIIFRVLNGLAVQTYFSPDEYWQGPEVAHRVVFGYGVLTWEWEEKIRSYVHPLIYVAPLHFLKQFGLDTSFAVSLAPRITQSVLAAVGDLYTYHTALRLVGQGPAKFTLLCQVCSWFNFYCSVRTFSNSVEAVLAIMALYYFPFRGCAAAGLFSRPTAASDVGSVAYSMCLAALAVVIRPSHGVFWLVPMIVHLLGSRGAGQFLSITFTSLACGVLVLGAAATVDKSFYGEWVLVPWKFLEVNVIEGISSAYGTHPIYWYAIAGFPLLLLSYVPLFVYGAVKCQEKRLLPFIFGGMAVLSTIPHKEERFLFPALPPALIYCGYAMWMLCGGHRGIKIKKADAGMRAAPMYKMSFSAKFALVLVLTTQISVAWYTAQIHQRGPVAAMDYVRHRLDTTHPMLHSVSSVHIWGNCHSTPFYSSTHRRNQMRYFECPPGERNSDSKKFEKAPLKFLNEFYSRNDVELPRFVVMDMKSEVYVRGFFSKHGYKESEKFFSGYSVDGTKLVEEYFVVYELAQIYMK